MRLSPPSFSHSLSLLALAVGALLWISCDSSDSGMDNQANVADQIRYDLTPQNDSGVNGTVTFWRAGPDTTLVTLDLNGEATVGSVSHPAHIHVNSASESGGIEYYLSAVNGSSPNGTTARKIGRPIEELATFNGHVNVHKSPADLETIVAQGDIGDNAEGTDEAGLSFVDTPSVTSYPLDPKTTEGSVFSDGVAGTVRFEELTSSKTLVTYTLNANGSVEDDVGSDVGVAQVAHLHNSGDGSIVSGSFSGYLGSIAPTDAAARSSRIINASYGELTSLEGYVNVHQSNQNLGYVFAQGDIGASAGDDGSSSADVTVTINNVGSSEWEVTSVDGASGVAGDGNNPTLTLTTGTRYRFVNNGGGAHPLGFQNSNNEYLLRQGGDGSLEGNGDIDYEEDSEGVTFTYTQELADAVANYLCTVHNVSMRGSIQTGDSGGSY